LQKAFSGLDLRIDQRRKNSSIWETDPPPTSSENIISGIESIIDRFKALKKSGGRVPSEIDPSPIQYGL
jgi:hypothetical protein